MVADGQWRVWIWRWIAALQRELTEGGLTQRAAALVYCSLLSLAPLLAVSFSLLKAFGVHNQIQPFLLEMLAPLGNQAGEISSRIIGFVENVQVGVLGFVGLATLFYTVVSLLGQVEESFNHIWRIRQPRPWVRRFSDYLSVVLVGPVLLFAGVGITASMSSSALAQRLIALEPFGTAYYLAGLVLPYVLVSAAFAFGYLFIPNTKVGLKPAAIGGVAAGLGWKLSGSLFTRFVADSAEYSAIYSGFAVVLVFMIWIYLSWIIVLLGGAVAFHCQHPSYLRMGRRNLRLSMRGREQLGILIMVLIGRAQLSGQAAWTLQRLADAAGMAWEVVEDLLIALTKGGLLRVLDHETDAYVLARDTDCIPLASIISVLRTDGESPEFALIEQDPILKPLLSRIAADSVDPMAGHSLRDIIRAADGGDTCHGSDRPTAPLAERQG